METTRKKLYEVMFLVDAAQAGSDWDGTMAVINRVLERAEAEIVVLRKWADRKLAYEIDHKSRGTYILCYFNADPAKISSMEKDIQLSEQIMRAMITTTDERPEEVIQKDIKGESPVPKDQDFDSSVQDRDDNKGVRSVSRKEIEESKKAEPEAAPEESDTDESTEEVPASE